MKNFLDKDDLRCLISRIKEIFDRKADNKELPKKLSDLVDDTSDLNPIKYADTANNAQFSEKDYINNVIHEHYATKNELASVEAVAKGRATGYVFDTETDMFNWLGDAENVAKLILGDNLYIRETDVPDFWWDGFAPQPLETQKVDLEEYAKKSSIPTKISNLVDDTVDKPIGWASHAKHDDGGRMIRSTYATKEELTEAIGEALEGDY